MTQGEEKASLTHLGYGNVCSLLIPFTQITVVSPAQATCICFHPATPRPIRYHPPGRFSPNSALCAVLMIRTIPLHSLCLFISLDYTDFRTIVKRFFSYCYPKLKSELFTVEDCSSRGYHLRQAQASAVRTPPGACFPEYFLMIEMNLL